MPLPLCLAVFHTVNGDPCCSTGQHDCPFTCFTCPNHQVLLLSPARPDFSWSWWRTEFLICRIFLESNYCKHWEQSGVWFPKCPLHTVNKTTEHDRVHHQHAVSMKADDPKLYYVPIFCMSDWTVSYLSPGAKRPTGADRVLCVEVVSKNELKPRSTLIWSVS